MWTVKQKTSNTETAPETKSNARLGQKKIPKDEKNNSKASEVRKNRDRLRRDQLSDRITSQKVKTGQKPIQGEEPPGRLGTRSQREGSKAHGCSVDRQ